MQRSEPPVPWSFHPAGQRLAFVISFVLWIRNDYSGYEMNYSGSEINYSGPEIIYSGSDLTYHFTSGYGFVFRIGLYEDVYPIVEM